MLIDAGASINMVNSEGRSALTFALDEERLKTLELLLEKGKAENLQGSHIDAVAARALEEGCKGHA